MSWVDLAGTMQSACRLGACSRSDSASKLAAYREHFSVCAPLCGSPSSESYEFIRLGKLSRYLITLREL